MRVAVILPAAGLGTRMGKGSAEKTGTSRKQFMLLEGSPILLHTVRKFAASDRVNELVVAVRAEDMEWVGTMLAGELHGVQVLNINELANALKPIVLPGETMRVFILKEGKEYNQGVAYLDDGTMVVVDNAKRLISKTIDITVTSVLQTTAGKMIFGKFDERQHGTVAAGHERPVRKGEPQPIGGVVAEKTTIES